VQIVKDVEGSDFRLFLRHSHGIFLEGLRNMRKGLGEDIRCQKRFELTPPEYKSEVLPPEDGFRIIYQ
jgi:hypothetical protein